MRNVVRLSRRLCAAVAIAMVSVPAFSADPLTLFLLRLLRDKIISAGIESAVEHANARSAVPPQAPLRPGGAFAGIDDTQLRRLIDEGFVYLTSAQRDEVYSGVRRIITDPKNAADVPAIIADLAIKASAVRQAHEQIDALPPARKRLIAAEARGEYEKMPPETREQMASVLRQRLVPLPADLTDMILAEFDLVRAQAGSTSPVAEVSAASMPPAASSNLPPAGGN